VTGTPRAGIDPETAVRGMQPYVERDLAAGTRLNRITRHMLGAFTGRPGARRWRRMLTEGAANPAAGWDAVEAALDAVAAPATA